MSSLSEQAARRLRVAHRDREPHALALAIAALRPLLQASMAAGGLPAWTFAESDLDHVHWSETTEHRAWPHVAGHARAAARRRLQRALAAPPSDLEKLDLLRSPAAALLLALAANDHRLALSHLGELEPVFRADLSRWWSASARVQLLQDKGLTDADAASAALDRLRERGLDWRDRTHHPYRVSLRWLKTTSYHWVLDQKDSDLHGDVDESRGGKTTSPESLLARAQDLLEQEERVRFAREDLVELVSGEKRKKVLLMILENPDVSSLEIALALGDIDSETAQAAGPAAVAARKRACNAVDAQRKYIREAAAGLWRNKAAEDVAREVRS